MPTTLQESEQKLYSNKIVPKLQEARELEVKKPEDRSLAASFCKALKELKEEIETKLKLTVKRERTLQVWKDAKETENYFYAPIDEAIKGVKTKVSQFDLEESQRARKEEADAEAERLKKQRKEEERLDKLSKAAEKRGDTEKADEFKERAETVTVAPAVTPTRGVKKLVYRCKVTNVMKACKSVTEGLMPFNVVEFKESALKDFAKGYNGKDEIPGLRFYEDVNSRL